jgi:toxin YoeB
MKILFSERAWEEYLYWQAMDRRMIKKINTLLKDISRNPYSGLGKQEALKHDLSGFWSRRIDQEQRLVYKVNGDLVRIISCRYHYDQ